MTVWAQCRYCQGSGSVVAKEKATGSLYGFACYCNAGSRFSALPRWNDRLKARFIADCDAPVSSSTPEVPTTEPEPF